MRFVGCQAQIGSRCRVVSEGGAVEAAAVEAEVVGFSGERVYLMPVGEMHGLLPNARVMHMDVKFPLDNYVRHLEATNELERKQYRDQFLRELSICSLRVVQEIYDHVGAG